MSTVSASANLKGKDLLTLKDLTPEDIMFLLESAISLKEKHKNGEIVKTLEGKTLGMIFEKSSTRTRVSFEAGMLQLGGNALFLSSQDLQIGRGETIGDTAQVLSQFIDAIMIRTFEHSKIEELAEYASIPVINGLTDDYHPCQALADLLTIYEHKQTFRGLKLAYVGDGNNVAHSLMIACAKMGIDCSIGCPSGYEPKAFVTEYAKKVANETGATITITEDPVEAVQNADAIYADVWTSMGQEEEAKKRLEVFASYQVNDELVQHAKSDYLFLHCLPAHREEEVTASIIDGPNSVVFQQAGNRMHVQKALLQAILA
ncbi:MULTISPECIES: ornithine carbamoyltransferase [Bacillaceae]|uniref:ornithine carbamoyltransferase n=1 Tax=Bacillaceae TaxID=186817 RepID=UPI0010514849|nr:MULTISPECIES: ornithine carbamoyltransferase [Bacillaceae]MDT2048115.1 ornithine carbamoyltransferase [Priestia flexa]TDB53237.1 ornithine carbamoyltransferase [Bacillus sp. CBEL-1]USY55796.1 ornithine carbamoyltransferase [Bacillus sp. 1780r2a1]